MVAARSRIEHMSSNVRKPSDSGANASMCQMRPWVYRVTLLGLVLAANSGCSSRSDDDDPSPSAGKSGAGSAGRSGSPARAGTGGTAPAPLECGSASCVAPTSVLSALPLGIPAPVACCVDEGAGECGSAESEGATCEPAATEDERCPGVDLSALGALAGAAAGGMQMTGCCTPDNACGLDGALFGRGCVENSAAQAQLGAIPLIGSVIAIPAARACDAPPAPIDEDAGI
jgi:hypothetical protein